MSRWNIRNLEDAMKREKEIQDLMETKEMQEFGDWLNGRIGWMREWQEEQAALLTQLVKEIEGLKRDRDRPEEPSQCLPMMTMHALQMLFDGDEDFTVKFWTGDYGIGLLRDKVEFGEGIHVWTFDPDRISREWMECHVDSVELAPYAVCDVVLRLGNGVMFRIPGPNLTSVSAKGKNGRHIEGCEWFAPRGE